MLSLISFPLHTQSKQIVRKDNMLTDNLQILITDEEIKLKRLKTVKTNGHRTNIKNRNRDNKILDIQKYLAAGRLVYYIYIQGLFNLRT